MCPCVSGLVMVSGFPEVKSGAGRHSDCKSPCVSTQGCCGYIATTLRPLMHHTVDAQLNNCKGVQCSAFWTSFLELIAVITFYARRLHQPGHRAGVLYAIKVKAFVTCIRTLWLHLGSPNEHPAKDVAWHSLVEQKSWATTATTCSLSTAFINPMRVITGPHCT